MENSLGKDDFKITNIILSQKGKFTLHDIVTKSIDEEIHMHPGNLKLIINNLRDSGLVTDFGDTYTLSRLML